MKKHGINSEKTINTLQKLGMLAGYIVEILASMLSTNQIDFWADSKNRSVLKKNLKKVFKIEDEYGDIREKWQSFYKENFEWTVDLSGVIIPEKPKERIWRLIIIAKGLTPLLIFNKMSKLFSSWKYLDDTNFAKVVSPRVADRNYAIWVRDEIEPELLNHSQNTMFSKNIIIETVEERMIHGMIYFEETGGSHLDIKGMTITSSRVADGNAVSVYWGPRSEKVNVNYYSPDYQRGNDGGRSVVL